MCVEGVRAVVLCGLWVGVARMFALPDPSPEPEFFCSGAALSLVSSKRKCSTPHLESLLVVFSGDCSIYYTVYCSEILHAQLFDMFA